MASRPRRTKSYLAKFLPGLWLALPPTVDAQSAPGLKAAIDGVRLDAERRPVVTLRLSGSQGNPLDLKDLDPNSVKLTIAAIKEDKNNATRYHNYVLTKVSGKEFVYKGETKKPALSETLQPDFDRAAQSNKVGPAY